MKNIFILRNAKIVNDNCVKYDYEIKGEWKKYFNNNSEFYVSYSVPFSKNISNSILNIPIISSIIVLAWLCNGEIICNELDYNFYNSLPNVKKGYEDMYNKNIFLGGNLIVDKLIVNNHKGDRSLCLFSGGVDAFTTFIRHSEEDIDMCCIWGADIDVNNNKGWSKVDAFINDTSKIYQKDYVYLKNPFRNFLNEKKCDELSLEKAKVNWYYGFEHSIAMLGSIAPLAYIRNIKYIYIASSFTIRDRGIIPCASDPRIDESIKYMNCNIVHDGFEMNRQDKIHYLSEKFKDKKEKIYLRVCWKSDEGDNCCKCEKCYRTIMGLYAEGENPNEWGFKTNRNTYKRIKRFISYKMIFSTQDGSIAEWNYIHDKVKNKKNTLKNDNNINWLIKYNIIEFRKHGLLKYTYFLRSILKKVKNKLVIK